VPNRLEVSFFRESEPVDVPKQHADLASKLWKAVGNACADVER